MAIMTDPQTATFVPFAHALAEAAGQVIMQYFRMQPDATSKEPDRFDPVTAADRAAEQAMRDMIAGRYPTHGIFGEEGERVVGSSAYTWVLDPIDGTGSFISGMPLWGTLIALNDGRRPVIGIMNQPFTRERFLGTPAGSFLNGVPIRVRACQHLADATILCTSPAMFARPEQASAFARAASSARLVRYGGDCYAYCMVACGHADAVIEANLAAYDVQALIPIVEGAGGVMTTWSGGDAQHGGCIVACADKRLHEELLAILSDSDAKQFAPP